MKATILEGTPEEIKKVLQAIASSQEQSKDVWLPKDSDNADGVGKDRPRTKEYCD